MSDLDTDLQTLVESFVNSISGLVREQALEAVTHALQGEGVSIAAPRKAKAVAVIRPSFGRPVKAAKRRAGEKRRPEELSELVEQLYGYIKANPGQGIEQIAQSLNISTKELTLPTKKLLADKRIVAKGQKRATKYSAR